MKDIKTTNNKLSRLIASRTEPGQPQTKQDPLELSLIDYVLLHKPIEANLFIYRVKEAELVNMILNNLQASAEATKADIVASALKPERAKSNVSLSVTALAAILGSALVFKQLKGYRFPFLGDVAQYFKSEQNVLTLVENSTNVIKELSTFELPEIPDEAQEAEPDNDQEQHSEESSIVQEALDRIYAAKAGIESITEAIKIQIPKTMDTISSITRFAIATTPFGILNLLFGKHASVITDKLRYRIESFYKNFWDSASTYIRDLFKWIQLKDLVNPVTGLASGFINFVAQKYGSFIRQFTGASSVSEESEVTQSSLLATTVTIFSRLTSTLTIKPVPVIIAEKALDAVESIRQNIKASEDEYEIITETITEGGGKVFVIGDSIAVGYMKATKFDGNAVGGKDPHQIISTMIPDFLKKNESGTYKTVVLSSGMTNAPYSSKYPDKTKKGLVAVDSMLQQLTNKKNVSVVLFGVVNLKHDYKTADGTFTHDGPMVNAELAKLAAKYGNLVRFTGPIPANATHSDKLHATNYDWVGNIKEGEVTTRTITKRVKKSSSVATSSGDGTTAPTSAGSIVAGTSNDPRIAKYVRTALAKALRKSAGKCATYVRMALNSAGFYNRKGKNQHSAYMYHSNGIMSDMGFKLVYSGIQKGYGTPSGLKTGDVIVWDRVPGHKHGHISITVNDAGKQCSDFAQNNFCIAVNYSKGGRYHVYRLPATGNSSSYAPSGNTTSGATTNTKTSKSKSSGKPGIGGRDIPLSRLKDESGKSISPSMVTTSNSGFMTDSDFGLSEIYTAANGKSLIRVVSDTKTVVARFNRGPSGHLSVTPESPRMNPNGHDVVMHRPTPRHTSGTLPEQSGPRISETPGRHPLDLLLSSDILGNMGTII